MKKRLISTMLLVAMATSLIFAGCGSENVMKEDEVVTEETETSEVEETVEETVEEIEVEESEAEVESTEVAEDEVEAEDLTGKTYERKEITSTYLATNFREDETDKRFYGYTDIRFSYNDYMDNEIMAELESRGYDITDFMVSYDMALNKDAYLGDEEIPFHKFEGIEDEYVKLCPTFIKYGNIDETRNVFDAELIEYIDGETFHAGATYDDDCLAAWFKIFEAIDHMRNDESFEEIDFKIPQTYFSNEIEVGLNNAIKDAEDITVRDITMNDWYNGMIYAMFVDKTVDLNGFFNCDSLSY